MREYFIAQNVANMMTKPEPNSGLDSQAIAGTVVTIEKSENNYSYVQTPDLYRGWVAQARLVEVWDRSAHETIYVTSLFADAFEKPHADSNLITKLVIGSRLVKTNVGCDPFVEVLLPNKQVVYVYKNCVALWAQSEADTAIFEEIWRKGTVVERKEIISTLGKKVVATAKRFMGTPYLWGGSTPFGMDCSGLTQLAYQLHGVQLLRNSYQQWDDKRFNKIEKDKELAKASLQAGDILVFDIAQKGKVDHIGIACGDGTFIQTRGEMKDGGMIIDQCADAYYNKVYIGAARLSVQVDINIKNAVIG